jgi:hypothetical protein
MLMVYFFVRGWQDDGCGWGWRWMGERFFLWTLMVNLWEIWGRFVGFMGKFE